ncbi:hypothetical protein JOF53_006440 [Crossiella equi]|uniref:Integrase SAM-like N-terminal domain-containing protein n=1 Tax=Crossiella equi TaxID=130796 RepID=A0ABS5ALY0_9PSEU|nr:N-terminal phage integrase SAM-like domain-containing protein [Crossiella equi]MBP2477568.1 hypothetical protein [Crossiella equi]
MGFIRRRQLKDGRIRYTGYYHDALGRERSAGTFDDPDEAERAWQDAQAKAVEARGRGVLLGQQRFARYVLQTWLPNHQIEANTREGYTGTIEKYLVPWFGKMQVNAVLPDDVREFCAALLGRALRRTLSASARTCWERFSPPLTRTGSPNCTPAPGCVHPPHRASLCR